MTNALNKSLVIVDVETTGFKPEDGHEVIEIGAQKVARDAVVAEFHSLLRPTCVMDEETRHIHGITDEMLLAEGKSAAEVFPSFVEFVRGAVLVGHNIQFDLHFINTHLLRLSLPILENQTIDTIEIARRYLILPSYSLEKVARYLKVPQPAAHRAMADVETTRLVLMKLTERARGAVA